MQADFIAPAIGVPLLFRFWEPTETDDETPEAMDISGASAYKIHIKAPDGSVVIRNGSIAEEGKAIEYVTASGDFPEDVEGEYRFHAIPEGLDGITIPSSPVARLFVKKKFSKR